MRVLYSFPDTIGKPGIGITAREQVRGLVAQGLEVSLYATSLREPIDGLERCVATLQLGPLRVPHRALGIARAYRLQDRLAARAAARTQFDVVHVWPQAGARTARAAQGMGAVAVREVPNTHTAHAYEVAGRAA